MALKDPRYDPMHEGHVISAVRAGQEAPQGWQVVQLDDNRIRRRSHNLLEKHPNDASGPSRRVG